MTTHIGLGRYTPDEFKEEFHAAKDRLRDAPCPPCEGRGVVTCADGDRYAACLYVLVRLLRFVGCRLPVECWHLRGEEHDPRLVEALTPLGVAFRETESVGLPPGAPAWHGGWQAKSRAVMACPWQEVLFIDADNGPTRDPEEVFSWREYLSTGALFWLTTWECVKPAWEQFGVPYPVADGDGCVVWETGQWAVDKTRCWPALALTDWVMGRSATVFQMLYGDPECFHVAWSALGAAYSTMPMPRQSVHTVLQPDPSGGVMFQHRAGDKWRLDRKLKYPTPQASDEMVRNRDLLNEDACFGFFEDYAKLMGHSGQLPGFPWPR